MTIRGFLLSIMMFLPLVMMGEDKVFTVVLDPGHGGKDPGASGIYAKEKNIVLSVAQKVGKLIESNHSKDFKLVYTRNSDVFIELEERAKIANRNKANIFISIHADAVESKSAHGAGTFTMGLNKESSNLEVAKRENSVILLEDNYQQRYEGFNPASAESYIMFELMQDVNMENSIELASMIQKNFVEKKRMNRGVRQAPYWVLHRTSMPSVLIELGFITNPEEEKYLKSENGQNELALCIFNAIESYYNAYHRKLVSAEQATNKPTGEKVTTDSSNTLQFKIQILASGKLLADNDPEFKKLNDISYYQDNRMYKYTYGSFDTEKEAVQERKRISKLFPDAFVVAIQDGKRIDMSEARKKAKE